VSPQAKTSNFDMSFDHFQDVKSVMPIKATVSEAPAGFNNYSRQRSPRDNAQSQMVLPKNSVMRQVTSLGKKIKSFFFGPKEMNTNPTDRNEKTVDNAY